MDVRALRELAVEDFAKREIELQPRIDAHITAYAAAVEQIKNGHRNIASGTDLEIGSTTRWSAIWELAGRCLSECDLLIHALRGGFALEATPNVRAMFEAMYLLGAVAFDDATARRWLSDAEIRPKKARAVMAKQQELARDRMKEAGVEPAGDIASTGNWLYQHYSKSAHHRRGAITMSVSVDRRESSYGPHPDPFIRGREVVHAGHMIETALIVVTGALADLAGRGDLKDVLAEQAAKLDKVRLEHPLD